MTTAVQSGTKRKGWFLEFLGSMYLAITILVIVAIASVIGTVLQQNQAYQDYIIKFGPFWHEMFLAMDLYDVYGATWFLLLLAFLVISTSVCIYRNAPVMLRDMKQFRMHVQEKSLRVMKNNAEWESDLSPEKIESDLTKYLSQKGYRSRSKKSDSETVISYMKGNMNRMGYLFTHVGMVVIMIGGLIDGNVPLAVKEWMGKVQIEKRNISSDQVPDISRLTPSDNLSFRGSITLPENTQTNMIFLNIRDGYLVQELPFVVKLKDFRIEHYPSGQPKSFESDLVIIDDQLEKPLEKTISVNYPLTYRGYNIYQASFGDGGSKLNIKAWPFFSKKLEPLDFQGVINRDSKIQTQQGEVTLEFTEFKAFNVFPSEIEGKKFQNFGPSFTYKIRRANGEAKEYVNYMSPVMQEGRFFFLTGMRSTQAEPFRFLHIPVDSKGTPDRFLRFHAMLNNPEKVARIAKETVQAVYGQSSTAKADVTSKLTDVITLIINRFTFGGYVEIDKHIRTNVPQDEQQRVAEINLQIMNAFLEKSYLELLSEEGVDVNKEISEQDFRFFNDAVNALAGIGAYAAPFYLQLADFEHIEASGLQITRAPGQNIVYLGCVMLMIGIFMMFYISHNRLWMIVKTETGKTRVIFAGMGNRNQRDFQQSFSKLKQDIGDYLTGS